MSGPNGNHRGADALADVLNPQYPSSWWLVAFSSEVGPGELVPARILERDIILWREPSGRLNCQSAICPHLGANIGFGGEIIDGTTVQCPFHGYRYEASGALCQRPGETTERASARLCLKNYRVQEWHGHIFLWNGSDPPDHMVVDALDDVIGRQTGTADPQRELTAYNHAFFLPFPAKWFIENTPDAGHFAQVHGMADWGEAHIVEESDWMLRYQLRFHGHQPFWAKIRRELSRGALSKAAVTNAPGDIEMTTIGGGVHVAKILDRETPPSGRIDRLTRYLESSGCVLLSWTPVNADSHVFFFVFLLPTLRLPFGREAVERILDRTIVRRDWGGVEQDLAIMLHRKEGAAPPYGRLDRALVKFRRFWDDRILDRSLSVGDGIHSNGLRAGIRWDDVPAASEPEGRAAAAQQVTP